MHRLITLLNGTKAIEASFDIDFQVSLFSAIKNGTAQQFLDLIEKEQVGIKLLGVNTDTLAINVVDEYDITSPDVPENSIAVITIEGIIYPWKTYRIEQMIKRANEHPNVLGVLLFVNTPGGYIHRVDIASSVIRDSAKPIAAYVTGVCASAGMWLVSGSKKIFLASKLDIVGSIGVMTTFTDARKFWEDEGIIRTDVYATKSTKKNEAEREAEKQNFEPIIHNLDFSNEEFHATIRSNLGVKSDSEVFSGATFQSEEAIRLGLAHELGSIETAMDYLIKEGLKLQANNY